MSLALALMVAAGTWALKGAGPQLRHIPDWLERRLGGLAPALLAALVMSQLTTSRSLVPALDAKLAGVGVASVLAVLRAPLIACVLAGAVTAAAARLLGLP